MTRSHRSRAPYVDATAGTRRLCELPKRPSTSACLNCYRSDRNPLKKRRTYFDENRNFGGGWSSDRAEFEHSETSSLHRTKFLISANNFCGISSLADF